MLKIIGITWSATNNKKIKGKIGSNSIVDNSMVGNSMIDSGEAINSTKEKIRQKQLSLKF